tara:strand:+ start:365 stop:550 length:186 start_codon:yes stop_codon:yes gene_type:complete
MQNKVWEKLLTMCTSEEEYNDIFSQMLLDMAQKDQLSMTWDPKLEEMVYYLTDEQKARTVE